MYKKDMLFDKYQYREEEIKKRGYSQHCIAKNIDGINFWVKWILGIEKNDFKLKMLRDRLLLLQGAKHTCLPDIIEYNFDTEQEAYAIVYKHLEDIESLENKVKTLSIKDIMSGLIDLADCLNSLHSIAHGDIHPGNIFVDRNGQFYLIDFQLSEITHTLSQEKVLEIFARNFAAPEKFDRIGRGFPYQADIYSFGKIIDWIFREQKEGIPEEQNQELQRLLSEKPNDRPRWQEVIAFLKKFSVLSETKNISIDISRMPQDSELLVKLNAGTPIFSIAPNKPDNPYFTYFIDIVVNSIVFRCSWIETENKLRINKIDYDNEYIERMSVYGEKLLFKVKFVENTTGYNFTPYFKKWFNKRQRQTSLRNQGKHIRNELQFYRELLEEELKVIAKNSLHLSYSNYDRDDDGDLVFHIVEREKNNDNSFILRHIENCNTVNSDGVEYSVAANADRKQNKDSVQFAGKPYEYEKCQDKDNKTFHKLKIKDCELRSGNIPKSGYIFENTTQKEEEKRRQLEAITKAEKNEVQNPQLIYDLFTPDQLPPPMEFPSYAPLDLVYQKDKTGNELEYSDDQNKAIRNAITKFPLSIIQGPPGTGKTTVITEIVFQILKKEPLSKILITSQTNNAVDQVLENLIKNGIGILRLNAVTALNIKEEVREHTLNKKLELWKTQVKEAAKNNLENIKDSTIKDELYQLYGDWINIVSSLNEESAINKKLIDSIRVIGATCNHIAAKKYSKWNFKFDYVIMDEAGKATTAESLVPIIMGNNLIFVGDHRQLRPMLTSTWQVKKWLREKYEKEADQLEKEEEDFNRPSLFEQVITQINQGYKSQLTECRRLPTEQVLLTSKYFYESEGDEAIIPVSRENSAEHNLPLRINSSLFFVDIGSNYKNGEDKDKSSYNKESAKTVIDIVKCLNNHETIKNYSIGIIACYKAQYHLLQREINKLKGRGDLTSLFKWQKHENKFMVSVVDRFQGLECDIIILDLVRSGVGLNLGFMENPNRINVALSRNKRLLVIVGDYHSIVNAKTRKGGGKVALQNYIENIKPEWIIPAGRVQGLFK